MNTLKLVYIGLLVMVGFLAVSIVYDTGRETINPTTSKTGEQEVVVIGRELIANYKILNPTDTRQAYTFSMKIDGKTQYESSVEVDPGSDFVFGGHYRSLSPGRHSVTGLVWNQNKTQLIKNTTYHLTIEKT